MNLKIITLLLAILAMLVVYLVVDNYHQKQLWQHEQVKLNTTLDNLQQVVVRQEAELTKSQHQVIEESQVQSQLIKAQLTATALQNDLLDQRLKETSKQTRVIDQQVEKLDAVVEDLAMKQHQDQKIRTEHLAMHNRMLYASNRSSGISTATMMKTYVAEYYMMEGRFPDTNSHLGLPKPASYSSDTVKFIKISKGGKISIVYTDKSGVDGGAIHLSPNVNNHQIEWRCSSRDFEDIQDHMPACFYGD